MNAMRLLSYILHAEIDHSDCGFKNCEMIVRGRRGVTHEVQKEAIMKIFSGFGIVKKMTFNENFEKGGMGIVCTLEYGFVTHALFAKFFLDGTTFLKPFKGMVLIDIKRSAYLKEIMRKVKSNLTEDLALEKLAYF